MVTLTGLISNGNLDSKFDRDLEPYIILDFKLDHDLNPDVQGAFDLEINTRP